jgi:ferredoxin
VAEVIAHDRATFDVDEEATVSIETSGALRPALLARYLDLANLRHDFPLVLTHDGHRPVATLTGMVNDLLGRIAPEGAEGERLRQHVLGLETAIRRRLEREPGQCTLTQLWEQATEDLLHQARDADALRASLTVARNALRTDGHLLPCDDDAPTAVLRHLRDGVERPRATVLRHEIDELIRRLTAVLAGDEQRSVTGRDPDRLRASVGTAHEGDFDFEAWSEILASRPHDGPLPAARCRRIDWALHVLRSQRFVPMDEGPDTRDTFTFEFDSYTRALNAYRERIPDTVRLVKATAVARLELDNDYDEAAHDAFFHAFDTSSLHPDDLLAFPSYLIVLDGDELDTATRAQVLDVLASPLPFKIVVVTADAVGAPPLHDPLGPRRLTGVELSNAALGLGTARLVQTTTATLARMSGDVRAALAAHGPALISIVTGPDQAGASLSPYLATAAACEARAMSVFTYDPNDGTDGSGRITLSNNPQPAADWPIRMLTYEDEHLQRVHEHVAFTVADLVATDPRFAEHVAVTPRGAWTDAMVPVADFVRMSETDRRGRVPYILAADQSDVLRRVVVDHWVVAVTEQSLMAWHRLQERSGVHASEERRRLAADLAALETERREVETAARAPSQPTPATPPEAAAASGAPDDGGPDESLEDVAATSDVAEPDSAPSPGEAWIETTRCTTCDECTNFNPRMFVYNEDKQACIADLRAGTFRDLVQAAEACQVAIIHPGEPWDPHEPGLDDLRRRAAAFA